MDDSALVKNTTGTSPASERTAFGMSSFGPDERRQFGQNVRLAMACIEGFSEPVNAKAMPSEESAIRKRLKTLSEKITTSQADLLELLVRFDDLDGWKSSGARHCAEWMSAEMGISPQLGWEYLRVGRLLRSLPTTTALFRAGKLSWSKIRVIVGVADADNEKTLCHAALDASVTDVKRLCEQYRWKEDDKGKAENERAIEQWAARSFSWSVVSNGNTRIQLTLPPETAQAFLNSVEYSLNQVADSNTEYKMSQRRADAAVHMAEASLQAAGREVATADRYQVIVSVESSELTDSSPNNTLAKRPTVSGTDAIAQETARRIACDCSLTSNITHQGEPIDIGRKSRLWPNAMARAIKERDQHCQFPGCTQSRHLQIHHIIHWADGGSTCASNGVCLCQYHHTLVHEGGYRIERLADDETRLTEQFTAQQRSSDMTMLDVEKTLRNDRESFNSVCQLSPTRYRFRVVDADGNDIRYTFNNHASSLGIGKGICSDGDNVGDNDCDNDQAHYENDRDLPADHSTRVECREPAPGTYRYQVKGPLENSLNSSDFQFKSMRTKYSLGNSNVLSCNTG